MAGAKRGKQGDTEPVSGVRERILKAAVEVLHESGLQRLTQTHVAERAGVRQSHLTYYFPTRRDLLEGVTAHFVEGITRNARRAIEGDGPTDADTVLARLAAAVADVEHTRMFIGVIVEADADPALRAMLVEATRQIEAALAESLGGADRAEEARFLLTGLWGLALRQFVMGPPGDAGIAASYLSWNEGAVEARRTRGG
jgi:AcrR family transcriptional regulator